MGHTTGIEKFPQDDLFDCSKYERKRMKITKFKYVVLEEI